MIKIPGKYCTDDLSLKYMKLNKKSYSKVWKKLRTIHRKLRLVAVMISIRLIWSLGMCWEHVDIDHPRFHGCKACELHEILTLSELTVVEQDPTQCSKNMERRGFVFDIQRNLGRFLQLSKRLNLYETWGIHW